MIEESIYRSKTFTQEQVLQFVYATEDPNPIHTGSHPIVPAIQLALFAKRFVETEAHVPPSPGTCTAIEITCPRPIYAGTLIHAHATLEGVTKATVDLNSPERAATVSLEYGVSPLIKGLSDEVKYDITRHTRRMIMPVAEEVAQALEQQGPDYLGLSIGMQSSVLLDHGNELVQEHARQGLNPVYAVLKIILYSASTRITQGLLDFEAATRKRENRTCEKKVVAKVLAKMNGEPRYSSEALLCFVPEGELVPR